VGEALGVPWRVRGHAVGSINAMMHEGGGRHFNEAHLRRLDPARRCAAFAAAAHHADGHERQVEARLRPLLEREEHLQREVEESRAAERALREHKALVDATLSIRTVGVLYFDLDGTVRDVNAAFERMTGYSCAGTALAGALEGPDPARILGHSPRARCATWPSAARPRPIPSR
jgi:PAS domain-containing protein